MTWATTADSPALATFLPFGAHIFAAGVEALGVTAPQILVTHGRATGDRLLLQQAAHGLEIAWRLAEQQGLGWLGLKVLILRALVAAGLLTACATTEASGPTTESHEPANTAALSDSLVEPLSARELEVLGLLASGASNSAIARHLVVEQSTIKSHLVHIYAKLGVHSRTQALARARALKLLE